MVSNQTTTSKITLDLYAKNVVAVNAKQYDDETRYIEITCVEDGVIYTLDKTIMSAFLRLKKPDDNGVFNEVEITDTGKIKIVLTEQMLAAPGRAIADVFLLRKVFTSEEKPTNIDDIYKINAPIISIMDFYINIAPTALNHSQIESSYEFNALANALAQIDYNNKKVVELDKTLTENENIRNKAEVIRQDNEQNRVKAENIRIESEKQRINSENTRISNEQQRITSEDKRKSNEDIRILNENERKSNETQRQTNENNRVSSETQRATSESNRQSNESIRQTNENTRQQNESNRKTNENERTSNENTRINTENERIKNENIRISNENIRKTQETQRQNDTATAIANANNAAKNANDKANDLQTKLDNHHFVLTNELENSVTSTSTTHAPTANAVKTAYDKAVSVENTINSNKNNWNDKYTKNEIDNKFSTLESNIDWKESVSTYGDIAKTYPNPQDGWTVNVKDTDYTYRYSGTSWVAISANAIPKATQSVDGLLSKEDKINYDDANSKKHTHSNKSVIDGITSALITTWNTVTNKLDKTGDASNVTNTITTASTRTNLSTGEKLSISLGKIAKWFADLKSVAFSGSYNDLSNKPTSLPASDVYSWAKASSKPSYNWSEINDKPSVPISDDYSSDTIEELLKKVQGLSPRMGSASITRDTRIAAIWWNFFYVPHRTGTGGDNGDYGTLLLFPMTSTGNSYIIRAAKSGTVATIQAIVTSANIGSQSVNYANSAGSVAWSNVSGKPSTFTPSSHKQAYTANECSDYSSDENTMGVTPAAVKKAIGLFDPKTHTHSQYLTGITKAMVTNALGYTPSSTDTNTWRGIQNNLTSDSTTDSLSAAQGKVLKGLVDGKAASSHTHSIIVGKGKHTETASGTTANAPTTGMADTTKGIYMTESYFDDNAPTNFGNIINIVGSGTGQIMAGWSGTNSTTEKLYYRSHRDTSTGGWGEWKTVAYTSDIPSVGNGTVTITQNGTTKGTFTMNQSGNTTIALTDTNTNTWRPLGTTADTACAGNDSRLSNARPANGGTSDYANVVWTQSHKGSWYINSNWDGSNFITNAKGIDGSTLPIWVNNANYASSAGNATTVNGHTVNSDVPSNATYIASYGSSDNYVFSDWDGSNLGTNYYYIRYTNGIQMIFIETHNEAGKYNAYNASGNKTISFPVSFVNNKYFAFGKQNRTSSGSYNTLVSFGDKNTSSICIYYSSSGYNESSDYFSMFFVGRWK